MDNPNSQSPLPSSETSTAENLALMLETACRDFETLQRSIGQRGGTGAEMALAKSFVFHVTRARRICEHGAGSLGIDRTERKLFLRATTKVPGVRDVNEHGFDPGATSKPSMHRHGGNFAAVDETSMIVLGPQNILMGPLNLYDVYLATDRIRKIAGFASLPRLRRATQ